MNNNIFIFILAGFIAQSIDGAVGMAYGTLSNTFLLFLGVPPVVASAGVHTSEVFTTLASGISHINLKNVNKSMLIKLVIPGIAGGIIGGFILSKIPGEIIRPYINIYLIIMGVFTFLKAFANKDTVEQIRKIRFVGFLGGFFDALGGGGWGSIVTSTLVASGINPRYAVGTSNTAEFFITVVQSAFLILLIKVKFQLMMAVGLAIGGIISAPFAALLCKKLPSKVLMIIIGVFLFILNAISLLTRVF